MLCCNTLANPLRHNCYDKLMINSFLEMDPNFCEPNCCGKLIKQVRPWTKFSETWAKDINQSIYSIQSPVVLSFDGWRPLSYFHSVRHSQDLLNTTAINFHISASFFISSISSKRFFSLKIGKQWTKKWLTNSTSTCIKKSHKRTLSTKRWPGSCCTRLTLCSKTVSDSSIVHKLTLDDTILLDCAIHAYRGLPQSKKT